MARQDDLLVENAVQKDERLQIDPDMAEGRASPLRIIITGLVALALIIVVLYGINAPRNEAMSGASHSGPMAGKTTPNTNNIADQPAGEATGGNPNAKR